MDKNVQKIVEDEAARAQANAVLILTVVGKLLIIALGIGIGCIARLRMSQQSDATMALWFMAACVVPSLLGGLAMLYVQDAREHHETSRAWLSPKGQVWAHERLYLGASTQSEQIH